MSDFRLLSAPEQVAAHIRREILRGRWNEDIPGIVSLADELKVNHKTVSAALSLLETEGMLKAMGTGRNRRVVLPSGKGQKRSMRVGMFIYEAEDKNPDSPVAQTRREIIQEGHVCEIAQKSLTNLDMNVRRISRIVQKMQVDAWILCGASSEVLEWFASQQLPVFAWTGGFENLPVAGAKMRSDAAIEKGLDRLIELGHSRVCRICRSERRNPAPGRHEVLFLRSLAARGITVGEYNLPEWDDTPEGLRAMLDSLFRITPPTALWVDTPLLFFTVYQFLVHRRLRVPEDVSMVLVGNDPVFSWCEPSIAHCTVDPEAVIKFCLRWLAGISKGHVDLRQHLANSRFVDGGSIGPARPE